jgi:hypothetical protein
MWLHAFLNSISRHAINDICRKFAYSLKLNDSLASTS